MRNIHLVAVGLLAAGFALPRVRGAATTLGRRFRAGTLAGILALLLPGAAAAQQSFPFDACGGCGSNMVCANCGQGPHCVVPPVNCCYGLTCGGGLVCANCGQGPNCAVPPVTCCYGLTCGGGLVCANCGLGPGCAVPPVTCCYGQTCGQGLQCIQTSLGPTCGWPSPGAATGGAPVIPGGQGQGQVPPTGGNQPQLGAQWDEEEVGWRGRWQRRDGTNTFDAEWTHPSGRRERATLTITLSGNRVDILRNEMPKGTCAYVGTVAGDGVHVSGTYNCSWARGNFPFQATISGSAPANQGGGTPPAGANCDAQCTEYCRSQGKSGGRFLGVCLLGISAAGGDCSCQ